MAENNNKEFNNVVETLLNGMGGFLSTKTVVGEAITVGDAIILPLVDVSFGIGAGAFADDKKNNGGGGLSGKMTPSAILVMQNGVTRLVNVKNQDSMTKILDMVPDIINKFTAPRQEGGLSDEEAAKAAEQVFDETFSDDV